MNKTQNNGKISTKMHKNNITIKYKKNVPMNCSPAVKGKTPIFGSCFTKSAINQIKEQYNKAHPNNKVLVTDPVKIWQTLRERFSTCNKEDCWLSKLPDQSVRMKLEKYIFSPFQPDDWKKNPSAWLSNFDIFDVLEQYQEAYPKFKVIGPTPIDFDTRPADLDGQCVWQDLCTFSIDKMIAAKKTKLGIVFNLDVYKGKGFHWVSMFVDLDDQYIFYMDSAGNKIPPQIDALVKRITTQGIAKNMHIHYYGNCPLEHQMGANECGMYALYFIITMLTEKTEKKVFKNYMEKIAFFKDKRIPDNYVNKYRKIYFNSS